MNHKQLLRSLGLATFSMLLSVPSISAQTFSTAAADNVALYTPVDGNKPEETKTPVDRTISYRIVELNGKIYGKVVANENVTVDAWSVQMRDWATDGNTKTEMNLAERSGSTIAYNSAAHDVKTAGTTQMQFFINYTDIDLTDDVETTGWYVTDLFTFTQGEINNPVEGDTTAPTLGEVTYSTDGYDLTVTIPENNEDCFYLLIDEGTGLNQVYMLPGTYTLNLAGGAAYNIAVQAVDFNGNKSEAQTISYTTPFDTSSNLALSRPTTASSGTSNLAVDGNEGTRWESAFTDTEWWQVELANAYNLNYIEIKWEVAYSKHFEIQTSLDGDTWASLDVTYDGSNNLLQTINMNGTPAKFVKFQGIERALQYGNSFYEFRVYGLSIYDPASADNLNVIQVSPATAELFIDETVEFTVAGISGAGAALEGVEFTITAPENVTVTDKGNGVYEFTTSVAGTYTVEIKGTKDENEATGTFTANVKALPVLTTLTLATERTNVGAAGAPIKLTLTAKDQHGVDFACEPEFTITGDAAGSVENLNYTAENIGTASIVAVVGEVESNPIEINIVAAGDNRALNAEVTGGENAENLAAATDGNWDTLCIMHTQPTDNNQEYNTSIVIDLNPQAPDTGYDITLVEVDWEGASAADYTVDFSIDGAEWDTAYTLTDGAGMTSRHDAFYPEVAAVDDLESETKYYRFVRLNVTKAATIYGVKVREVTVYGISNNGTVTGIDNVEVESNEAVEYYNLQGVRVDNPENGLYIRRQGNTATKVLIK